MLKRMILATAATALSFPAMASCLEDRSGAQCDLFLDEYRAAEIPVGTTMIWRERPFLLKDIDRRDSTDIDATFGRQVIYSDGRNVFLVPENSGARMRIADW